jgi:hypothetical protein
MTLSQFNKLSLDEKGEYTFKSLDVSFVAYRSYYGHKVSLYAAPDFFIEVFYFPVENRITRIEGIEESHKNIDLYIKKMSKKPKDVC